MADDDDFRDLPDGSDEEAMKEAFRRFLQGGDSFDPADLMKAAGISLTPDELQAMMTQLGNAFGQGGVRNPMASRDHAVSVAKEGAESLDPATAENVARAASVAGLWLNEVVDVAELPETPLLATRIDWARKTLPVWEEISEPVAVAIPRAVSQMMTTQVPEDFQEMLGTASSAMETVGKSLFQLQLAQVVGTLSKEVLSGGDIGIPLIQGVSEYDVHAVLVVQNIRAFSQGLDVPIDEADIFISVREIAHARLFRHARWLRLHMMSAINDFATGITLDTDKIMNLAENFDPTDTDAMRDLVASGKLLPERTEQQTRALARLENMLALVEGWVDHVTQLATTRLPKADALGEAVRRRRASGGPAEHAFATLVGLELRPRRLREASALWAALTERLGTEKRDALWQHPDSLPTAEDLDNPEAFLSAQLNPSAAPDDMDQALQDLLDEESAGS